MSENDDGFVFRRPVHNDPRIDKRPFFRNWTISILPYIPAHAFITTEDKSSEDPAAWFCSWSTPAGIWTLARYAVPDRTALRGPKGLVELEGYDSLKDMARLLLAFGAIEKTGEDQR